MIRINHTSTSQNGQNKVNKPLRGRNTLLWIAGVFIWLMFIAGSALADTPSRNQVRKMDSYKVTLADLSNTSEPRLDWRNPVYNLQFETPTSDWVERIDLYLKIHAEGRVNASAPIYVQFNNADPVPISSRGNSFEARLSLDISKVKAHRNTISIRYANESTCLTPQDGAYSINMEDSLVVVKASTPSRAYYLRDVKDLMNSPMTAPKTIAINAVGSDKLTYEALAAQGLALNMPELPRFNLSSSLGDMQVHIGTRQNLSSVLRGSEIAKTSGPVIGIVNNAPLRMVITADNSAELRELMGQFATRALPAARRTYAHAGEFIWQSPMIMENAAVSKKTYLHELGNLRFDRGLGNSSQLLEFDVDNPLSASGKAKIYFDRSTKITSDSKISVSLNGYDLGLVTLTKSRNSVNFDIPRGMLVGTDNQLIISPDLSPSDSTVTCGTKSVSPNVFVGSDSYISINSEKSGFNGDLTRFAASGFPFSSDAGSQTAVVFSTKSNAERAAALRAYAQLGKVYGSGWNNAKVYSLSNMPSGLTDNILLIGPHFDAGVPRGLANVSQGRLSEPRTIQTANLAHPTDIKIMRIGTPVSGGIAAIYENPNNDKRLKAYLTVSRGQNFTRAMDQIVETKKWNKLQGSMSRWNGSTVEMTKTAFDIDIPSPASPELVERLELPTMSWPTTLPKVEDFKVNMSPVFHRLTLAASNTRNLFSNFASGLLNLISSLLPDSAAPALSTPNLGVEPESLPGNAPSPKPIPIPVPKPAPAPVPASRPSPIVVSQPPISQSVEPVLVMEAQNLPQYIPGASLRGLSNPATTPAEIGPAQYKPMGTLTDNVKTAYDGTSGWMSGFLNKFLGSAEDGTDRKANLLIFAAAMILLLLLLALARPHTERYD